LLTDENGDSRRGDYFRFATTILEVASGQLTGHGAVDFSKLFSLQTSIIIAYKVYLTDLHCTCLGQCELI